MKRSYVIDGLKAKLYQTGRFAQMVDLLNMKLSYDEICKRKEIQTLHIDNFFVKPKYQDKFKDILDQWVKGDDLQALKDKYAAK